MGEAEAQGRDVVASDVGTVFCLSELLRSVGHLPSSVVDEPESTNRRESERQTESILSSRGGVRWRARSLVEDDKQDNEENLVDKLAPALHQEGHGDTAATVETILLGGHLASGDSIFERRGGGNRVLATDTQRVEEQGPGIANDPALESKAPRGSEHEKTNKHDDGILDQAPATTNPVTNNLERTRH